MSVSLPDVSWKAMSAICHAASVLDHTCGAVVTKEEKGWMWSVFFGDSIDSALFPPKLANSLADAKRRCIEAIEQYLSDERKD